MCEGRVWYVLVWMCRRVGWLGRSPLFVNISAAQRCRVDPVWNLNSCAGFDVDELGCLGVARMGRRM